MTYVPSLYLRKAQWDTRPHLGFVSSTETTGVDLSRTGTPTPSSAIVVKRRGSVLVVFVFPTPSLSIKAPVP